MKTTVLAVVLVWAMGLGAQIPTPPQVRVITPSHAVQTNPPSPTIEDPAEYEAYVNAVQQIDPVCKIGSLQAFLAQYPNSVMKVYVLRVIAATKKMMSTSSRSTR